MQNHQNSPAASNQGWFTGAPTTRIFAFLTGLSYVLIELNDWHDSLAFDTNAIIYRGQVYRYLTGSLAFRSAGESIVGSLLLLNLSRRFEREMGSRKFSIWLAVMMSLSTALQILLAFLVLNPVKVQYSGPYPMIGALAYLFHTYTPRLHPRFFGLLGLYLSEKTLGYAFCAQIIFYRGYSSIIPCLCGSSCAWFYTMNPWLASHLELPDGLASTISDGMLRFVVDDSPGLYLQQQVQQQVQQQQAPQQQHPPHDGFAARPPIIPHPTAHEVEAVPLFEQLPPPPESSIEQLTSMGFEREAVLKALKLSHNDVERAADKLLTGSF